jgi:hypothetical protein
VGSGEQRVAGLRGHPPQSERALAGLDRLGEGLVVAPQVPQRLRDPAPRLHHVGCGEVVAPRLRTEQGSHAFDPLRPQRVVRWDSQAEQAAEAGHLRHAVVHLPPQRLEPRVRPRALLESAPPCVGACEALEALPHHLAVGDLLADVDHVGEGLGGAGPVAADPLSDALHEPDPCPTGRVSDVVEERRRTRIVVRAHGESAHGAEHHRQGHSGLRQLSARAGALGQPDGVQGAVEQSVRLAGVIRLLAQQREGRGERAQAWAAGLGREPPERREAPLQTL